MYSQQSQHKEGFTHGDGMNVLYRVLSVVVSCITPIIRSGFGSEGLGLNGFFALLLLIVVAASVPDMQGYLGLWIIAVVLQRIATFRNRYRGLVVHSRYGGYPWLAMRMPLVRRESTALLIVEPLLVFGLGGVLYTCSADFGHFMMACAVALFLKCLVEKAIHYKRLQRMRDAEIEQRWYSEQLRKGAK
jgi:hypothetical protein